MPASDDDREEEIEALKAIYDDDIKIVEAGKKFSIRVVPNAGADEEDNPMQVQMTVEFTDAYPDEVPKVQIRALKGLTRHQVDPLAGLVLRTARDNLGTSMVFELCNFVVEWLQNDAEDPRPEDGDGVEVAAVQAAALEKQTAAKKSGTAVTRELFHEWKAKFDKEVEERRRKEAKAKVKTAGEKTGEDGVRMTGRQIFDKAMGSVDWELFQDPVEGLDDEDFGDDDDDEGDAAAGGGSSP